MDRDKSPSPTDDHQQQHQQPVHGSQSVQPQGQPEQQFVQYPWPARPPPGLPARPPPGLAPPGYGYSPPMAMYPGAQWGYPPAPAPPYMMPPGQVPPSPASTQMSQGSTQSQSYMVPPSPASTSGGTQGYSGMSYGTPDSQAMSASPRSR